MVLLLDTAEVRRLLAEQSRGAVRSLGQNFVTDPRVIESMVDLAGISPGERVLEVGPGLGSLTLGLTQAGALVLAIEKDPGLARVLDGVLAARGHGAAEVHLGDALEVVWPDLLAEHRWKMVSNLPYNVAVPIVLDLLAAAPGVDAMWVMVQREVAQRLCARPGGRTIGVPTVKAGWYAGCEVVMEVPPESFTPRPKVTSAVVELKRRPPPRDDVDPAVVFTLVEVAYRKRRKMLRSSLAGRLEPEHFEVAGVESSARPEELTVDDWANLAAAYGVSRDG